MNFNSFDGHDEVTTLGTTLSARLINDRCATQSKIYL